MANSDRSKPMIRSNAAIASAHSWSNTPAAIHSSRRVRSVVSETRCSRIASMSTHDDPVVNRIRNPQKQSRSEMRGRWQPSGCSGGSGSSGSMAAKTASTTSGSSARMMSGDLPGRSCWAALGMKTEPTHRPVDGHHSPPTPRVLSQTDPHRQLASSKRPVLLASLGYGPVVEDAERLPISVRVDLCQMKSAPL